jgi:hypothetical protein
LLQVCNPRGRRLQHSGKLARGSRIRFRPAFRLSPDVSCRWRSGSREPETSPIRSRSEMCMDGVKFGCRHISSASKIAVRCADTEPRNLRSGKLEGKGILVRYLRLSTGFFSIASPDPHTYMSIFFHRPDPHTQRQIFSTIQLWLSMPVPSLNAAPLLIFVPSILTACSCC